MTYGCLQLHASVAGLDLISKSYIRESSCGTRLESSILGKHVEDKAVKFLPNVEEDTLLMQAIRCQTNV